MTLNHDDPRLTAYVLGELDDDERRVVEAELARSPAARGVVEEIRRAAELLSLELAAEPCPAVYHDDHVDLQSAAAAADSAQLGPLRGAATEKMPTPQKRKRWTRSRVVWTAVALAVSLGFVLLSASFVLRARQQAASSRAVYLADASAEMSGGGQQSQPAAQAVRGTPSEQAAVEGQSEQIVVGDFAAAQGPVQNKPPAEVGRQSNRAAEIMALREQRQAGILDALGAVERGHLPIVNEPTIVYPPVGVWSLTTEERDPLSTIQGQEVSDKPFQVLGQPSAPPPSGSVGQSVPPTVAQQEAGQSTYPRGIRWRGYGPFNTNAPTRIADIAAGSGQTFAMGERANTTAPVSGTVKAFIGFDGTTGLSVYSLTPLDQSRLGGDDGEQVPGLRRRESGFGHNTEAYDFIVENPFLLVTQNPLSTFSIDVDTASYANVRRFLNQNTLPPPGAVRIEELVNYFRYDYAGPEGDAPFATHAEVAECPWQPEHRLVRIGLKGREIEKDARPPSNLVFLLDVSGSMRDRNKLPLVKKGMRMLVEQLTENDRIAIVVYASASGLVLDSMPGDQKESILASIDRLEAGGSTNGASGIQLAYQTAVANFLDEGTNRVILATDGDFNVGTTDQSQLVELIENQAKSGVFLSVLGFGMGNLKDSTLEKLADKGNGNYAYIDTEREARKVLVEELSGTLITIAKDVKIQIEFNPAKVAAYRLIGYENRLLAKEDFNDDTKDAGEIGAGHTVTALYEIVPAGEKVKLPGVDELEYQVPARLSEAALESTDLLTLKLRYKEPDGEVSKLLKFPVADAETRIGQSSDDYQFAAAVAAFGMILRGSQHRGQANLDAVLEMARAGMGADVEGYRSEFVKLVTKAQTLVPSQPAGEQSQEESSSP